MRFVSQKYVRYYNKKYGRTGSLWEGRFKSCIVETDRYLLACYRYIEMNPVRAGMVKQPADYAWSSYAINAGLRTSSLVTPHETFLNLGNDSLARGAKYQKLFAEQLDDDTIHRIRVATNKNTAFGTHKFEKRVLNFGTQSGTQCDCVPKRKRDMNRRSFLEISSAAAVALGLNRSAVAQSGGGAEARIRELGLELPEPAAPVAAYVPYRLSGNQVFIAGNIPPLDTDVPAAGKVGADLTPEQGYAAARLAGLRVLAQLRVACGGDLDRVVKALQVRGFVNCSPDFTGQSGVVNGASELFRDVFGDAGVAARAALGANALPLNAAVEIESIWEIRS